DVLNRINPSYRSKAVAKDDAATTHDDRKLAENIRQLSKYIFARQYGLNTPFCSTATKSSSFALGDYLDRETEIKTAGPCKTPKRLKDILPHLERLLRRHGKCGYLPLRDRACPSKVCPCLPGSEIRYVLLYLDQGYWS
ncbi:hypothetical protein BDZ97DRAFT_1681539, partial [Flammula alnicola]